MKVLGVLLLIVSGGLIYLKLVKGQTVQQIWTTATTFFQPAQPAQK